MRQPFRSFAILVAIVLGAAGQGSAQGSAQGLAGKLTAPSVVVPAWGLTGSCAPIDFDSLNIEWYASRGIYILTVSGIKPYTNMEVSLSSQGYASRPAYWRTVVIGCVKNFLVMPIPSPYNVTMALDQSGPRAACAVRCRGQGKALKTMIGPL
jgi:hypothetical protein